MAKKRFQAEQIIGKLREAEVEISKGGLRTDQAKQLKELEKENARLKKLVANQALDMKILRDAASGNF